MNTYLFTIDKIIMFNKEKTSGGTASGFEEGDNETVIGASVKVDGDFISEGNVLVQGIVNGSLKTTGNLKIEESAKIKANIEAQNAIVHGMVKGNVAIQDNLEIGSSAKIEGDITTKILSIEPGAMLHGHCSVSTGEVKQADELEPASVQKPSGVKKMEA